MTHRLRWGLLATARINRQIILPLQFTCKIDNCLQHQVHDSAESIIDKKPSLLTPAESCMIVSTLERLLESVHSGLPVTINPAVSGSLGIAMVNSQILGTFHGKSQRAQ